VGLHLSPIVEGDEAGATIVFLQGWPDDASLWREAVSALRDRYRCVRVTLPNYGGERTARWGYSTAEIIEALEKLIREAGRGQPVTLVMHDWGCYWGHAVHKRCPELVSALAGVDIAPQYRPTIPAALGIVAYQGWLLGAFALAGPVGDWMTRRFATYVHAPMEPARITAWMNYPYRNIWADILSGRLRELTKGYWPGCPLLFVYGERKLFHFHSSEWVNHVRSVGGQVVGLPCDHWVPRDASFVSILAGWLDDLHLNHERAPRTFPRPSGDRFRA
jgi:pimeloyl-ACP methyl ester carboxylesterase